MAAGRVFAIALASVAAPAGFAGAAVMGAQHPRCPAGQLRRAVYVRDRWHGRVIRVHGHAIYVRRFRCVAKPKPVTVTTPGPTTTVTTTAPTPPTVRPALTVSHTQDQANPLKVTWSYNASNPNGPLPDSTLQITISEHAAAGQSYQCTIDVGEDVTGGTCTATLSQSGSYDIVVTYAGGRNSSANVSPSSLTDTEEIS